VRGLCRRGLERSLQTIVLEASVRLGICMRLFGVRKPEVVVARVEHT
jgi:hypothetical protein